jgi:hypothetical protein
MNKLFKHNSLEHRQLQHKSANEPSAKTYYWVWATLENGRHIIWGAYNTYNDAENKAYSKLGGNFEVVPLKTRDESEASRILRAKYLEESGDVEDSFKRFKHTQD